jgi:hypothetical protein
MFKFEDITIPLRFSWERGELLLALRSSRKGIDMSDRYKETSTG